MISVIVPAFNTEKYLVKCVESILKQDYKIVEIILIDDSSTDSTGKLCDNLSYRYENVSVIHQKKLGPYLARAAGIKKAKGEYITFVDSDDWIENDFLTQYVDELSMNDKDVDIIVGGYIRDKGDENYEVPFKKSGSFYISGDKAIVELMQRKYFDWSVYAKLYNRRVFDKMKESSEIPQLYGDDIFFVWEAFRAAKRIYFTPVYKYHYCVRSGSLMTQEFSVRRLEDIDTRLKIIAKESETGCGNNVLQSIAECLLKDGRNYLHTMAKEYDKYSNEIRIYAKKIYECFMNYDCNLEGKYYAELKSLMNYSSEDYHSRREMINNRIKVELKRIQSRCKKIFIYGTGVISSEVACIMLRENVSWEGYIVTDLNLYDEHIRNFDIRKYKLNSINDFLSNEFDINTGIILAMNEKNTLEVMKLLKHVNVNQILNLGEYSLHY